MLEQLLDRLLKLLLEHLLITLSQHLVFWSWKLVHSLSQPLKTSYIALWLLSNSLFKLSTISNFANFLQCFEMVYQYPTHLVCKLY